MAIRYQASTSDTADDEEDIENGEVVDSDMVSNSETGGTIMSVEADSASVASCKLDQPSANEDSSNMNGDEKGRNKPRHNNQQQRRKKTQKCDIFSCGLVYYYVLVPGSHPFVQWFEREANIFSHRMDLSKISHCQDAFDLIQKMLCFDEDGRPTAKEVSCHPFFWMTSRRLDFFCTLSDRLEQEPVVSPVVLSLEANAASIVGKFGWDRYVDVR